MSLFFLLFVAACSSNVEEQDGSFADFEISHITGTVVTTSLDQTNYLDRQKMIRFRTCISLAGFPNERMSGQAFAISGDNMEQDITRTTDNEGCLFWDEKIKQPDFDYVEYTRNITGMGSIKGTQSARLAINIYQVGNPVVDMRSSDIEELIFDDSKNRKDVVEKPFSLFLDQVSYKSYSDTTDVESFRINKYLDLSFEQLVRFEMRPFRMPNDPKQLENPFQPHCKDKIKVKAVLLYPKVKNINWQKHKFKDYTKDDFGVLAATETTELNHVKILNCVGTVELPFRLDYSDFPITRLELVLLLEMESLENSDSIATSRMLLRFMFQGKNFVQSVFENVRLEYDMSTPKDLDIFSHLETATPRQEIPAEKWKMEPFPIYKFLNQSNVNDPLFRMQNEIMRKDHPKEFEEHQIFITPEINLIEWNEELIAEKIRKKREFDDQYKQTSLREKNMLGASPDYQINKRKINAEYALSQIFNDDSLYSFITDMMPHKSLDNDFVNFDEHYSKAKRVSFPSCKQKSDLLDRYIKDLCGLFYLPKFKMNNGRGSMGYGRLEIPLNSAFGKCLENPTEYIQFTPFSYIVDLKSSKAEKSGVTTGRPSNTTQIRTRIDYNVSIGTWDMRGSGFKEHGGFDFGGGVKKGIGPFSEVMAEVVGYGAHRFSFDQESEFNRITTTTGGDDFYFMRSYILNIAFKADLRTCLIVEPRLRKRTRKGVEYIYGWLKGDKRFYSEILPYKRHLYCFPKLRKNQKINEEYHYIYEDAYQPTPIARNLGAPIEQGLIKMIRGRKNFEAFTKLMHFDNYANGRLFSERSLSPLRDVYEDENIPTLHAYRYEINYDEWYKALDQVYKTDQYGYPNYIVEGDPGILNQQIVSRDLRHGYNYCE